MVGYGEHRDDYYCCRKGDPIGVHLGAVTAGRSDGFIKKSSVQGPHEAAADLQEIATAGRHFRRSICIFALIEAWTEESAVTWTEESAVMRLQERPSVGHSLGRTALW
jgi:hypothetical protein